jgi:hypothetical protein
MTTTSDASVPAAGAPLGLRIFLIVLAAIETLSALSDFPVLFDPPKASPGFETAQAVTNLYLMVHPLLAIVALVLASMGRLRHAIMVLAVMLLANWLSNMPGAFIHGLEWGPGLFNKLPAAKYFGYPVIGVVAFIFAWKNKQLWLAALLTAVPLIAQIVGVLGFAIGVTIYGF